MQPPFRVITRRQGNQGLEKSNNSCQSACFILQFRGKLGSALAIEVKNLPLYDYKCYTCGHKFTVLRPVAEKDNVQCPKCKGEDVRQAISPFSSGVRRTGRGGCGTGGSSGGG